jgi:AhpC/TSA family protein
MPHTIFGDKPAVSYLGGKRMGFRTKDQVDVGSVAPDFTLPSQSGEIVSLRDIVGKKPVVLFFYPKDDTLGCTKEVCAFRDEHEEFAKLNAEVMGISSDSVESHRLWSHIDASPQSTIFPSPCSATSEGKSGSSMEYQAPLVFSPVG